MTKKIKRRKKVKKVARRRTPTMILTIQMIQVTTHPAMIHLVKMRSQLRRKRKRRRRRKLRTLVMMTLTQALPIPAHQALTQIVINPKMIQNQINLKNQNLNSLRVLKSQRSMSSCSYQEKR